MTSLAKKHDESKPSARFVVLMGLLFTGEDAGLLSIEALRTSPVSIAYTVALATAAVATVMSLLQNIPSEPAGEEGAPRASPCPVFEAGGRRWRRPPMPDRSVSPATTASSCDG